jgi:hypothetical protein
MQKWNPIPNGEWQLVEDGHALIHLMGEPGAWLALVFLPRDESVRLSFTSPNLSAAKADAESARKGLLSWS